ncbi:MAG: DUF6644 family protein [Allosphingosinicella sp.]
MARLLQESGWLYAGVNTLHVLGIALLVGAIVVLDLRLLRVWRGVPLPTLAGPAVTVASAGLCVAIPSGAALLTVQATEYVANPFLYVKFAAILVGLLNVAALRLAGREWTEERFARRQVAGGLVSLVSWLAALTAGRLIAYW